MAKSFPSGKLLPQCDPTLRNALAREHWPRGIAFTQEQNVLMGRGWPRLRVLVDNDPRDQQPDALAAKVLDAIDPVIPIYWPREAAKRFICKYAGLDTPTEITAAVVDGALDEAIGSLGYAFPLMDALFLAECFLGAELVADRIVARLERFTKADWANDNPNDLSIIVISLLEPLLLRMPYEPALALIARLRKLSPAKQGLPAVRLKWLLDAHVPDAVELEDGDFLYNVPVQISDRAALVKYLAHEYTDWLLDPQHLFIAGPGIVDEKRHIAKLKRMPAWRQKWFCEVFGIIQHPIIAKMMKALEGSRGAGGLPEAWLAAHGDGEQPAPVVTDVLSKRELDAAVKALFEKLVAEIQAVRGDPEKEQPIWVKAVGDLVELRAAAGDPTPEAHVGHILALDGWGPKLPAPIETLEATEDENDRWMEFIDEGMR